MTFRLESAPSSSQLNELSLDLHKHAHKGDCWRMYYLDHLGPVDPGVPKDTELKLDYELLSTSRNSIPLASIKDAAREHFEALQGIQGIELWEAPSKDGEPTSQHSLSALHLLDKIHGSEETPLPSLQVSDDMVDTETGDWSFKSENGSSTISEGTPQGQLVGYLEQVDLFSAQTPILSIDYACGCGC